MGRVSLVKRLLDPSLSFHRYVAVAYLVKGWDEASGERWDEWLRDGGKDWRGWGGGGKECWGGKSMDGSVRG